MSKVIFKLKFQSPNRSKTKMNNMYHLLYIGTREGVALNDDLKVFESNQDWGNTIQKETIEHILEQRGIKCSERDYDDGYYHGTIYTFEDRNGKRLSTDLVNRFTNIREILKEFNFTDNEINILKSGEGHIANCLKAEDQAKGISDTLTEPLTKSEHELQELVKLTKKENLKVTSNEEYVKYISNRPRSHGLFTSEGKVVDIQQVANHMKDYQGYVYRGIISLREEDAVEKGFDNKEKWESLIRDKMFMMSKQLNIPYSKLKWVGAFHRESGHPHVHLMMWNSEPEVRNIGVIPSKNIEAIRKSFTNEIFREERESILSEKNLLRDYLVETSKGAMDLDMNMNKLLELESKYTDISKELLEQEELTPNAIGNKIRNSHIKEVGSMINALNVPQTGRLQYKFMPPEVKSDIDKITEVILKNPSFEKYFNDYLKSVENYVKLYTDNPEDIESAKENAKEDIYKRIGNNILKCKKEIIIEHKATDYVTQNLLMNVISMLSQKSNQKENQTRNLFGRSKEEKKKLAKESKAKGLYSEYDLQQ